MSDDLSIAEAEEIQENQPIANGHATEEPADLIAKTLAGDLRDFALDLIRDLRDPWHKLPEAQQQYHAQRIQDHCQSLVTRAVTLIAGRDFPTVSVALEQVTFKPKGIETKMTMSGLDRQRKHELVDAQNKVILLVIADPNAFMGARGPVKIDPPEAAIGGEEKPGGEPELPLAAGVAPPHAEAHKAGYDDAVDGAPANNPFAPGVYGHADYMLGYAEGEEKREARQPTAAAAE